MSDESKFYKAKHFLEDGRILIYVRPVAKNPIYHRRLKVDGINHYNNKIYQVEKFYRCISMCARFKR